MSRESEVWNAALTLGGAEAEAQSEALQTLCAAALQAVEARLRPDAQPPEEILLCAAAYLALSWLAKPQPGSFTAGSISVTRSGNDPRAAQFSAQAEQLLAPYVLASDFAFLGVEA